jgi:cell division protein FtsI/penicillin-binding protein 2
MVEGTKEIGAIGGVDLVTYIDKTVQLATERELKKGIERYGAVSGTVIVMDPRSGGILAMNSLPSYEPVKYWEYGNEFFLNPAISSSFEPGSVFKVIIMASALDAEVVEPDTRCDICYGPFKVDKYYIETWNQKYNPDSSMTDVIVNSDNVGMSFVAEKMGKERLIRYLKQFGIGKKTEIDLQGELVPPLRNEKDWSEVDLVTAGFGQGIAVTPIQLIKAVGAIANGGVMVKPKIVNSILAGSKVEKIGGNEGERVISAESAKKVTAMMVEAAEKGESKWTYQKGFRIAGKTGTAQIPIAGHYDEEKTIASFVGFAPYDDPKFVMLVTLKEPKSSPWASETAAPLWYAIAKDLFLYFGIQPDR